MTVSLPLACLLGHTADAVQAVRAGQSLNEALARCPAPARPGTQALSFQVLRRLGTAMALRARLAPKTPPPALDALLLSALALLWPDDGGAEASPSPGEPRSSAGKAYAPHTLVDQAVQAARERQSSSAGFVNAVLRRALREQSALAAALADDPVARHNHPAWWIDRLRRDWPAHWQQVLAADNRHPPMTLRVNLRRGSVADYLARLADAGQPAWALPLPGPVGADVNEPPNATDAPGAGVPGSAAVLLAAPVPVDRLPGFADGDVSVQDAAAQLAAHLLLADAPGLAPLPAGARVLDACASPGGKTAQLLEQCARPLDLLAIDLDPQRLSRVDQTLARLHLSALEETPGRSQVSMTPSGGLTRSGRLGGTIEETPGRSQVSMAPSGGLTRSGRLGGTQTLAADASEPGAWWDGRPFDAILLDAPCSASGIVRRHPDIRWLRRPGDIAALAITQARLLDALWPLLAPGGRLLYCTCSVFKAEGQGQIDAFLQRRPDAALASKPPSPGHLLPLADNPEQGAGLLWPASDGFFLALLVKSAGPSAPHSIR